MAVCSQCGTTSDGAKFCPECGTPLAVAAVVREERKVVSVLFCDLVGFTSRSEAMDVEDVRGTLQPYHALLRRELERHGGTVEKFIGDAVMAVFGAPVAHEDDPERAVRAAFAIVEAVAELREREPTMDLHVRIGVNTGEALIALGADPSRGEGMASGDVVNTAARLESAAPTDGVLVGEVTYRATNRAISYEQAEPVAAKGKSEPVSAWRAMRARSRFGVDVDQGSQAAMVGRAYELSALTVAASRAIDAREVQLVTVVGVPGIGKSRLVWELSQWVDSRPELIRWRQGRCLPYGDGVTYWALGEIIKAQAGVLESDSAAAVGEKLDAMIAAIGSDPTEVGWLRGPVAGLVGAEESVGGSGRDEAFVAWRRLFEALAGQGPMVLVFEDVHWADDAMLDFIDHLVEWASGVPLLVVCSARPELLERRRDWGGGKPNAATIALRPLSADDTRTLVGSLLERVALSDEMREMLLERAEGNPLYAEEFVRMLHDRGAAGQVTGAELPESVQGIIAARLDALPADEKQLLQDAAVLGKVVWLGALAALGDADRWQLEERMHRLARKEFLRRAQRSSIEGDTEYAFRHVLVRDVAYNQIPRAQRADKHERAASWINSLSADRDDAVEMRAHHLSQALGYATAAGHDTTDLRDRTRQALRHAGDRALRMYANASAAAQFRAALSITDTNQDRGYLLLELGRSLYPSGQQELRDAIDLLVETDPAAAAVGYSGLGFRARYTGDGIGAQRFDSEALRLAQDAEPSRYKARALERLAGSAVQESRYGDALGLLDAYLSFAESVGEPPDSLLSAHAYRGVARIGVGDRNGLEEQTRAVEDLTSRNYYNLGSHLGNLANSRLLLRSIPDASRVLEKADEWIGTRDPFNVWSVRLDAASLEYLAGAWESALARADEYDRTPGADSTWASVATGIRTRISSRRLGPAQALDLRTAALALARAENTAQSIGPELAESSRLATILGDTAAAATLLDELLDLATDATAFLAVIPYLGAELAETAHALNRAAELRSKAEAIPLDTPWKEALLASLAGDHAAAAAIYTQIGSLTDAAFSNLRSAETLAQSDPAAAATHLEQAVEFYLGVDATLYLKRAERIAGAIPTFVPIRPDVERPIRGSFCSGVRIAEEGLEPPTRGL